MIQTQCRRAVRRRVAYPLAGSSRSGALRRALETRGLGQVHREAVAPTLVNACHFRRNLAEVLLDVAFVELDRRGQAGAKRMSREFLASLAFGRIAEHACRDREAPDEARDVAVVTCSDPTSRPTTARNTGPQRCTRISARSRARRPGRCARGNRGRSRPRASRFCHAK